MPRRRNSAPGLWTLARPTAARRWLHFENRLETASKCFLRKGWPTTWTDQHQNLAKQSPPRKKRTSCSSLSAKVQTYQARRVSSDPRFAGAQNALVDAIAATGKPIVLIVEAGRPLTIGRQIEKVDSVLYSFHAGTMAGPALADLIWGIESPSGKLPVTIPKTVGQIPLYYNHTNTGTAAAAL